MEPRIQYAKTSDGVSIAYASLGTGPTIITTPSTWESIDLILGRGLGDPFYKPLARSCRVVRYDRRGTGLSDRDRGDFTLDGEVRDLEAVVNASGAGEVVVMGSFHCGPAAIVFAAQHPDRVIRLILYGTYSRGHDLATEEVKATLPAMVRSHWGMASRTLADVTAPGVSGEVLELIARNERESASGETVAKLIEMGYGVDAQDSLSQVAGPTLVLHRRGDRAVPFRMGRELASRLANADLVPLDGDIHWPWLGDTDPAVGAVLEFVGGDQSVASVIASDDTHTILFTDVEGSTALTDRLGDAKARDLLREHERITREALRGHGGSEVKTMGDGFMASFGTATKALECAIAIQQGMTASDVRVRIGLNAGEPIEEDEDLFGTAVNMAARIAAKAEGGEILVSDVVRQLVAGKKFLFNDRGEAELRGFEEPVRVYEVRWRDG
ncbi:MAG TPA: adenylate/guanylate cyclase domain-containing protein [Dehalococcoidia bacterium]